MAKGGHVPLSTPDPTSDIHTTRQDRVTHMHMRTYTPTLGLHASLSMNTLTLTRTLNSYVDLPPSRPLPFSDNL